MKPPANQQEVLQSSRAYVLLLTPDLCVKQVRISVSDKEEYLYQTDKNNYTRKLGISVLNR